jgi:hypothetical protein
MLQRRIARRALAAAVGLAVLMTAVVPVVGIATAATPSTNCQTGEGTVCWLDISAPSSVRTGVAFTVQVRVTTDPSKTTVAKTDPCGSKAQIRLDVTGPAGVEDPGPTTTYIATASAGIATFNITISNAGDYDLDAMSPPFSDFAPAPTDCSSTSFVSDNTSLMAVFIPADSPIAPCPRDTNCVQATSGTGTQATLIGELGSTWSPKQAQYFSSVGSDTCASPPPDPNGVLGYTFVPASPSLDNPTPSQTPVIILALDMSKVTKGIGQFMVCWTQPTPFLTATGATATKGDLPPCKNRDQVAPCVLSKTSGQHNVGFFTILATSGDPRTYVH